MLSEKNGTLLGKVFDDIKHQFKKIISKESMSCHKEFQVNMPLWELEKQT